MQIADFDDKGNGTQAKELGQPLEAKKDKKTDSPLEHPERTLPCCYLDFILVKPKSDFWHTKKVTNCIV